MNKVTAGIPSLTPKKRQQWDYLVYTRAFQEECLLDKIRRDAATVAPDGDVDRTVPEAQAGRLMYSGEIIRRLRQMNPHLIFELSNADPDKMGIYVIENRDGVVKKRFVCGMQSGCDLKPITQRSVVITTYERYPDPTVAGHWLTRPVFSREVRGWETVLMRLLREKLITQPQIDKYFNPSAMRSSKRWQQLTT